MRSGWGAGMSWLPVTVFYMSAFLVGLLLCSVPRFATNVELALSFDNQCA